MWWLLPAGMAAVGGMNAEKKRNDDIANNEMQAEISKYAPWTGKWGSINPVSGGFIDGAMQGAMSGLSMGQNLNASGLLDGRKAKALNIDSSASPATGWATLEGSKYLQKPELGGSNLPYRSYFR